MPERVGDDALRESCALGGAADDPGEEIHETTLIYPAAAGRQGRPRARTQLAEIDHTQRRLYDALDLAQLAATV